MNGKEKVMILQKTTNRPLGELKEERERTARYLSDKGYIVLNPQLYSTEKVYTLEPNKLEKLNIGIALLGITDKICIISKGDFDTNMLIKIAKYYNIPQLNLII